MFAEEQGSFLVGAAAALKTQDCHIGFVGGVERPLIQKFEAGFAQGANAVAPDITDRRRLHLPGGRLHRVQRPRAGRGGATGQLDWGADVIYHAAGASGQGVFQAWPRRAPPTHRFAIGVDSDQYNTVDAAASSDVIITSMLKRVDVAVFNYINAVAAGDTSTSSRAFDLKVDGVGYSTTGGKIDDIAAELDAYKAAIINGDITVSTTP